MQAVLMCASDLTPSLPPSLTSHLASYSFVESRLKKALLATRDTLHTAPPTCHAWETDQAVENSMVGLLLQHSVPVCSVHLYFPIPASSPGVHVVVAFAPSSEQCLMQCPLIND